jgi:hypothetical protein
MKIQTKEIKAVLIRESSYDDIVLQRIDGKKFVIQKNDFNLNFKISANILIDDYRQVPLSKNPVLISGENLYEILEFSESIEYKEIYEAQDETWIGTIKVNEHLILFLQCYEASNEINKGEKEYEF